MKAPRLRPWAGPIFSRAQLSEAEEQHVLSANHGSGALVAYGECDLTRPPVVLVHGLVADPSSLVDIADRLREEGKQVFFFCYDDRNTAPNVSGAQLAGALVSLRAHYGGQTSLDLVAHSMGGIVSRCALNTLAAPGWRDGSPSAEPVSPRAGFSSMRVRAIDTPWQGFGAWGDHLPLLGPVLLLIARFVMWVINLSSVYDMRSDSQTFAHLFDPPLAGVDWQDIAAEQSIRLRDAILSMQDLDASGRLRLVRFIAFGELPADPGQRNLARSLAQDSRFAALQTHVLAAIGEDLLSATDENKTKALLAVYRTEMPTVKGSHAGVLVHRMFADDITNRLAHELT